MKMKELPHDDRPYERCMSAGPEALSDTELLAIILRSGARDINSMELAARILSLNSPADGILGLLHVSSEDLMKVRGIGKVKAAQLLCIGELSKRIWRRSMQPRPQAFRSPDAIAEYYRESMRHMETEQIRLMMFNTRQMLIRETCMAKGSVNAAVSGPREIFIEALRHRAVTVVLVHNHPSGDPEPSRADILLTQQTAEAGKVVGIPLLDHLIIGDGRYISLKERGYIE